MKGKTEVRSDFVPPNHDQLPSTANPCQPAVGHFWVHAYPAPDQRAADADFTGKWLVRMDCPYVEEYWGRIRRATEEGALGIGSKISTDWGMKNDPSGSWRKHVVCVYTWDWGDEVDVLRVAHSLRDVGAVTKMLLSYKPDIFTRAGQYEGNSSGDLAIYGCKAPFDELIVNERSRDRALAFAGDPDTARRVDSDVLGDV